MPFKTPQKKEKRFFKHFFNILSVLSGIS